MWRGPPGLLSRESSRLSHAEPLTRRKAETTLGSAGLAARATSKDDAQRYFLTEFQVRYVLSPTSNLPTSSLP
jgi:hypothetical protein